MKLRTKEIKIHLYNLELLYIRPKEYIAIQE